MDGAAKQHPRTEKKKKKGKKSKGPNTHTRHLRMWYTVLPGNRRLLSGDLTLKCQASVLHRGFCFSGSTTSEAQQTRVQSDCTQKEKPRKTEIKENMLIICNKQRI